MNSGRENGVDEQESNDRQKSKSQIKREMQELQQLGKQLVELPIRHLATIPLSENLRDAVMAAKRFKHGALRRQLQYIGALMPKEDVASIRSALTDIRQPHIDAVKAFHELEQWREQLLSGNHKLLDELAGRFSNLDRQHVRQLIRNAKKEQERNKPPKSARLLFKYLSGLDSKS